LRINRFFKARKWYSLFIFLVFIANFWGDTFYRKEKLDFSKSAHFVISGNMTYLEKKRKSPPRRVLFPNLEKKKHFDKNLLSKKALLNKSQSVFNLKIHQVLSTIKMAVPYCCSVVDVLPSSRVFCVNGCPCMGCFLKPMRNLVTLFGKALAGSYRLGLFVERTISGLSTGCSGS
jgi:hypothetical protein